MAISCPGCANDQEAQTRPPDENNRVDGTPEPPAVPTEDDPVEGTPEPPTGPLPPIRELAEQLSTISSIKSKFVTYGKPDVDPLKDLHVIITALEAVRDGKQKLSDPIIDLTQGNGFYVLKEDEGLASILLAAMCVSNTLNHFITDPAKWRRTDVGSCEFDFRIRLLKCARADGVDLKALCLPVSKKSLLHLAAEQGAHQHLQWLLDHANLNSIINRKTAKGYTPLGLAQKRLQEGSGINYHEKEDLKSVIKVLQKNDAH